LTGQGGERGLGSPRRLASRLQAALGLGGPVAAVSCACSSGLSAIALAARWIEGGRVEAALVVGVDVLSAFVLRGFSSLLALDPGRCRPFDAARRGLSLGEGAGALLLGHAEDGAAWVAGWGESNDANHVTGPSRDGVGLSLAAGRALARAGLAPEEIGFIHLHGTGTRYNDASEALAMEQVFGGGTPPAVGTKANTGHTLGAAGLLESLVALGCLERGLLPANLGLEEPDVASALDLTRGPRSLEGPRAALKVCAGFGGIDTAIVLRGGP
jgi:3-oxoacyl-(acyl-carrier-protein) synthase